MTLVRRVARVLRVRPGRGEREVQTELNDTYGQLDRLADSRSTLDHDIGRELRLAERLEADAREAAAAGAEDEAQALFDRRDAVLVRLSELRAVHQALTEAITQRATAANRLLTEQFRAESPGPAGDDAEPAVGDLAPAAEEAEPAGQSEARLEVGG